MILVFWIHIKYLNQLKMVDEIMDLSMNLIFEVSIMYIYAHLDVPKT